MQDTHPAIIEFYHYFDEPKRYMLVQELCPIGDFYKLLAKKNFALKMPQVAYVIR